jgi:predicted peptidase
MDAQSAAGVSMSELAYLLYVPEGTMPEAGWPLILYLHGASQRGSNLDYLKSYGMVEYLEQGAKLPAYVAAPQLASGANWIEVLDALNAMLDTLLAQYPIDADSVMLTGFSMGGYGVKDWALHSPERFAAVAVVGGSGLLKDQRPERLKGLPLRVIHSAADEIVSVQNADKFVQALRNSGVEVEYIRHDTFGHRETSNHTFYRPELYDWLLQHNRSER